MNRSSWMDSAHTTAIAKPFRHGGYSAAARGRRGLTNTLEPLRPGADCDRRDVHTLPTAGTPRLAESLESVSATGAMLYGLVNYH